MSTDVDTLSACTPADSHTARRSAAAGGSGPPVSPRNTTAANGRPSSRACASPVSAAASSVRNREGPGNSAWTATPLTVRKGDRVVFNVTGQVQLSTDRNDVAEAAGSLTQRRAQNAPLPQNLAGALIARVGNSAPFPIGNVTTPVTMPADGQLYLGINDDEVGDNKGEFIVKMTRQRR